MGDDVKALDAAVPTLLPARMLNEFSYCPRLFYLEWVQSRFVDNDDTVEGSFHHRRVDKEKGSAPLPSEGQLIRAQSLTLSSEELGIIAKIDLVESDGEYVRPVDTKRGHPPDIPERAWEPERVQICAQGLLLREAGYRCDEGILYFAGARERVVVPFTEDLIDRTRTLLRDARATAARDLPPAPLVDSPKCPRCSLVGICLPDEVNVLAERMSTPHRKLMAADNDSRPLYIQEQGARVGVDKGRVVVRLKDEVLTSARLIDISQICLYGNVQVSTQALRRFFAREIPVCFFSYAGWFSGIATGLPSKHVELRRRQVVVAGQGGLDISRTMVAGKIGNARTLLRRNSRRDVSRTLERLRDHQAEAFQAVSVASLLGIEGAAARDYFQAFSSMFSEGSQLGSVFEFTSRNRRPPKDPVNALLSFVYALLVKDLTAITHAVGFDPYLGFYHRPRYGRPALALDLAEEFRHLVGDSVVLQVINNGEVRLENFIVRAGGVALDRDGRRAVLRAYERRVDVELSHPIFGYRASYRRMFDLQARLLAAHVLGEVPDYVPLVTR